MILFINEFSRLESSSIPLLIAVFLFLRSFTSMRSNFAIAIMMISLVCFNKKKYICSILLAVATVFIHVISAIYLLFYFFYWLYRKRNMNIWKSILLIILSYVASLMVRYLMISGTFGFLAEVGTGAYASYAGRSLGLSFAEIFNVSNIPQILLFFIVILNRKKLDAIIVNLNEENKSKLTILRYLCYFDFFVVPMITLLGVYRGYEFFYLPRLLLWGEIIPILLQVFDKKSQNIMKVIIASVFLGWMANRLAATIETSNLMPYIFGGF
jgi:hypothetical protein